MAKSPSLWTRVALALASLLIAALVFEIGLRVTGYGPVEQVVLSGTLVASDDPELGYELLPGASEGDARISSQGLRDREYAIPKPPGVFRIAALGDSVTYASTLHRDDAWPQQLAKLFSSLPGASERAAAEVLNFGVTGYNLPQIVRRLETRALAFEPDLIVYGYVLNDVQEYSYEFQAIEALRDASAPSNAALRLLSRSRLFALSRYAFRRNSPQAVNLRRYADPAYVVANDDERTRYYRSIHAVPDAGPRLDQGFSKLAELSRARGIPCVVAIFPLFHVLGGEYPLRDVHDGVAARARAAGLIPLDLLGPFQAAQREAARFGIERLDSDFLHPNAAGQRVAAISIGLALLRAQLLPAGIAGAAANGFVPHPLEDILDAALPEPPPRRL